MCRTKLLTLGLLTLFITLYTTRLSAQNEESGFGQIEGVITESVSGDPLIGVNVIIKGTSQGNVTDVDGKYIIRRVRAGEQTLVVSYIGYEVVEQVVQVKANETLTFNVALVPRVLEGAEIVVSSQAEGQRQAINEQISSQSIINVVSAEKIRELPDESAATALSRLPGISLESGDKVVVRGIQSKLNTILVNGIELPSTDANDRSTNLGFISSNMLSGIEVTKAVTPDMAANAIGGVVNLRLQEAPEGLHFDVMTQGGYNTQDATAGNYQVWASISDRFFNNKLGVFLQGNAKREHGGSDYAYANYGYLGPESNNPEYGMRTLGMSAFTYTDQNNINEQQGGSLILDYKLPKGKFVLQNTYANTDTDLAQYRDILQFNNSQRRFFFSRDIYNKSLLINSLQFDNDFDFVKVEAGFSHAYSNKDTDLRYGDPSDEFGFVNGSVRAFDPLTVEQRMAYGPEDIFKMDLYPTDEVWQNAGIQEKGVVWDETFFERRKGATLDLTFPVELSSNFSGKLKVGGAYNVTTRENDLDRVSTRLSQIAGDNYSPETRAYLESIGASLPLKFADFRDTSYDRKNNYLGGRYNFDYVVDKGRMDKFMRLAPAGWNAPGEHISQSAASDYDGEETLTSFYGMGEFKIGSKLTLLGGVRYEKLNMQYNANFVYQTDDVNGNAVIVNNPATPPSTPKEEERLERAKELTETNINNEHFFPNVQLRYEATDWFDIRLAYTKTLSRPDYSALLPSTFRNNPNGSGIGGNPYLKPAVSTNLDAYLSFYTNEIGLFTIGAFYKEIEDIFIQDNLLYGALPEDVAYPDSATFAFLGLTVPVNSATVSTYFNNPEPAYIYGVEFDWQTVFWYLPKPFNNMVLNINYTRSFSKMDYRQIRIEQEFVPFPRPHYVSSQSDTLRTARLLQQGNDLVNVALGADYKGFSGRFSFRMQGDVLTGLGIRPEEDSFTGNIYNWDFTIRQRLPIQGLSLFANGINIFHNPIKDYRKFSRGYTYADDGTVLNHNITTNLRQISYSPRRFQLGVRYSF